MEVPVHCQPRTTTLCDGNEPILESQHNGGWFAKTCSVRAHRSSGGMLMLISKTGMRVVRKAARQADRHASSFSDELIETTEQQRCLKNVRGRIMSASPHTGHAVFRSP
jgi:hypothetical protein